MKALNSLRVMVLAVVLVAWATARRVLGPMRALAVGADRLGRGLDANPLPLTGPSEVRNTTQAFNRMQDRLTRFVSERTHMLAALSHDLRSPLTAMRLRIEMLDDDERAPGRAWQRIKQTRDSLEPTGRRADGDNRQHRPGQRVFYGLWAWSVLRRCYHRVIEEENLPHQSALP